MDGTTANVFPMPVRGLETATVSDLLGKNYSAALKVSFPDVDPGVTPFGYLVLVQLRSPRKLSKGGLIIPDMFRDAERYRVQTGLVRALGPSAFKNRVTMEPWVEGAWCHPGDFIRMPMYGGDRWIVPVPGAKESDEHAVFMICKDTDLIGRVTGDPMAVVTS
jgi:co-chaperonin GroES (HSP10)